jgi:hypothetical protein
MATVVTQSARAGTLPREKEEAPVRRVGFWSATSTALCSIAFSVTRLLALSGLLHFPLDPVLPDGVSFFLALSFVIMMASIHRAAVPSNSDTGPDRSIWSQVGLAFATMYAGLVLIVYMVIITVVVPYTVRGQAAQVAPFAFDLNGSFMQAVDGLGYFLMCLATWFAAPVFAGPGIERWLRRFFALNGAVGIAVLLAYMPLVIPAPYYQAVEAVAGIWILSLPACAVLTALYFRRAHRS